MKRRSPWLAFAACALLNGTVMAEPVLSAGDRPQTAPATLNNNRPGLALGKAATAAEAELEKRGLANDHFISSIALVSGKDRDSYYTVQIEPPILTPIENADPARQTTTRLALQIEMDGRVTAKQVSKPPRVRVVKSN